MGYRSDLENRIGTPIGTFLALLSLTACDRVLPIAQSGAIASPSLQVQTITQPKARIRLVTIPVGQGFRVIAAADRGGVQQLSAFAADEAKAIAIINGGYFDPKNRQTTAFVTAQGQLLLDPRQNKDLMANANVAPYMARILSRSEFRHYRCRPGTASPSPTASPTFADRYDITAHDAPIPSGCQLRDGLGAGPQLLPTRTDEADALYITENGRVIRDPIGRDRPNARSAVAIKADGSLLLAMVSQLPASPASSGMTLTELAAFLKSQGAVKALNLDGGTSSSLWLRNKSASETSASETSVSETSVSETSEYGQFDAQGEPMKRPVKSVLMVVQAPTSE
jgi:Phosphodiester glycosidase